MDDDSSQSKPKMKRKRINELHRWTDSETVILLGIIEGLVKNSRDSFERPTSQRFYKMVSAQHPLLENITWTSHKSKMRHLKAGFKVALNWKHQALADGEDEANIAVQINKICPHFDVLYKIFGETVNCDIKSEPISEELLNEESSEETQNLEYGFEISEVREAVNSSPENSEPEPSQSGIDLNIPKIKRPRKNASISTSPLYALISIQEKKLRLEIKKFELEQLKEENKIKLKEMEFHHQFELKKLELEKQKEERLLIERLRLEADEKIRKFEIEFKAKNNL